MFLRYGDNSVSENIECLPQSILRSSLSNPRRTVEVLSVT